MVRGFLLAVLGVVMSPMAVWAFSSGPPIMRVGIPEEGGLTCTACHRTFSVNPPGGSLKVEAVNYKPGQRQTIRVTVTHPEAQRWGFQLSVRKASDHLQKAGTFLPTSGIRIRCAPDGRDATSSNPCAADQVEFAEHTVDITRTGENGTKVFEVDWMAPDSDIGDVVFYASGNAANGDGTNAGDRIYNNADSPTRVSAEAVCPTNLTPTISGVNNAANGSPSMAINTLISIYGTGFATAGSRTFAVPAASKFPLEVACVAVEINGARVPVTFVSANQINAQVPTITMTGPVSYRVLVNGVASSQGTLTLVNVAPALFTFNGTSVAATTGDGATPIADSSVVSSGRPARPGEVITIYATGLGVTDPVWQAGEMPNAAAKVTAPVTVTLGGTTLAASDVQYAGVSPGSISGLYQLNVRIPDSTADGNVPVVVTVGGSSSASGATIPVKK